MAKRRNNRAARRLFGAFGRLSNTRRITFRVLSDHWSCWRIVCIDQFKPSRSQRRAKRFVEEMRIERHFEANCLAGMNDDQAWAEAVKTIKG